MQIRKVPVMLSLLITLALLFGGWFFYQKTGVEGPLRQEISQMSAAELDELQLDQNRLIVRLTVRQPEEFARQYSQMMKQITARVPDKQIVVELTNQDQALQPVWDEALFALTEAIELHQYSKIPELLETWKKEFALDLASTNIDQHNVFIYLKRGSAEYYAIVPRTTDRLESEVIARG